MNIGENIKKYRKLRGLRQVDLAEKIGMSEIGIRNYESNRRSPRVSIIQGIAEVLEVPMTDLLGLQERPARESISLSELCHKQYKLDELVLTKVKEITPKELLLSRVVAMFTEVGEWANEEQSMKYWKKNKSNDRETEMEEFVDVLFFWLSIANLKGYSPGELEQAYLKKWQVNIDRQKNNY